MTRKPIRSYSGVTFDTAHDSYISVAEESEGYAYLRIDNIHCTVLTTDDARNLIDALVTVVDQIETARRKDLPRDRT